jgi:hypothetical protein
MRTISHINGSWPKFVKTIDQASIHLPHHTEVGLEAVILLSKR